MKDFDTLIHGQHGALEGDGDPFEVSVRRAAAMPDYPDHADPADWARLSASHLPRSLDDLAALVQRDLDLMTYPMKAWTLPRRAPDGATALDVLIVGAGQAGLAAGFGLMQQRVTNILTIDDNGAGREGPWGVYARMETLRTRKQVNGTESGVPNLSLRAWFEAQYGRRAWEDLYKIPTNLWRSYLDWFRTVTRIPVRNHCRMVGFGPSETPGLLEVEVEDAAGQRSHLLTRTLVLATGMEGNGRRRIPALVSDHAPKRFWAHTQEDIDFEALAGKKVAVLGGGASAFDNAVVAAQAGANRVDLYHRSPLAPPINPVAWGEFNGFLAHFPDLGLIDRWRFTRQMRALAGGPPQSTVTRAMAQSNLIIHPGVSWEKVTPMGERVHVAASDGARAFDFLILGSGYEAGLDLCDEFTPHLGSIALWEDVFTPPEGEGDPGLLQSCYLGPNFEMQEKRAGCAPWLGAVFNFSRGANLSMGAMSIGLSGIKFGIPRLVQGVTKHLFVSDKTAYLEGLKTWQRSGDVIEL